MTSPVQAELVLTSAMLWTLLRYRRVLFKTPQALGEFNCFHGQPGLQALEHADCPSWGFTGAANLFPLPSINAS